MNALDATLCEQHLKADRVVCDRCGTFGCQSCFEYVGSQRLCPACVARQLSDLPSLTQRARLARVALFVMALVHVGLATAAFADQADVLGAIAVAWLPLYVVTVVLFCRWFHLAVRHAAARGVNLGVSPGGAVGSFFIPFVNLVRPFEHARGMMGFERGTGVVTLWQALWLLGNISDRFDSLFTASALLLVGAAIAGAKVVDEITAEQTA